MQLCRELNLGGGGKGKEDKLFAFNEVQIFISYKV